MERDNEARKELFKDMERSPLEVGVDGDPEVFSYRNSSSVERLREQQEDGVIAAVLFPNTQPPFAPPAATSFEAPPYSDNFEHRWAGLRAHNRWLADFVSEAPERRAGIIQIFLVTSKARSKKSNGRRTGTPRRGSGPGGATGLALRAPLLKYLRTGSGQQPRRPVCPSTITPAAPTPNFGSHFPRFVGNVHARSAVVDPTGAVAPHVLRSVRALPRHELRHHRNRNILGARHAGQTRELYHRMKYSRYGSESIFGGEAVAKMSLTTLGVLQPAVLHRRIFLRPAEAHIARSIGVEHIMWGSDYPHIEGSYPHTREHLRLTFAQMTLEETTTILTDNAAEVYKFDLDALAPPR